MADRQVIGGATIVTGPNWVPQLADLLIVGSVIEAIEPPGHFDHVDAEHHDLRGHLLTPGLVNGHTHSHSMVARGASRDWTLEASLLNGGWMAAERTTELAELSAVLAAAEMLASGATAAFDLVAQGGGPDPDGLYAVAAGYAQVGLRARLAPMVADRSVHEAVPAIGSCCPIPPAGSSASAVLEQCRAFVTNFPTIDGIEPAVAPTIPSHCSTELMVGLHRLAAEHDLPVHLHLAESKPQAISGAERFGRSITAELHRVGLLDGRLTAAHGIWVDQADIELLAGAGAAVVTVPGSNLRLGSGVAPTRALLDAGVTLAIGTDGANSADALDVLDATRLANLLCRITTAPAEEWLSVAETLDAATVGGVRACGWTGSGRLAAGQRADLAAFDLSGAAFCPANDVTNQLLTAARAVDVAAVMVGGAFRYRGRRVLGVDMEGARSRFAELAEELVAGAAEARHRAEVDVASASAGLTDLRSRPWPISRLVELDRPEAL